MSSSTNQLIKNILSGWSSTVITAVIALFMSPFLVHTLGKSQYGIWALVLSVISYTSLLDAGMNQTLSRFIPKYYGAKDYDNLNEVINSSALIYSITGSLIMVVSIIISLFFIDFFNIDSEYLTVARFVLLLVGFNQAIRSFYIVPSTCGPFHKYTISHGVDIVRNIIGTALTVYFLKSGYGILAMAVITVVMTIASMQVRTLIRNRLVPQIKYSFKYISKTKIREMLSYGGISFLIVITYLVIFNTDNIIIGIFQSTTAVTFFSIAGSLMGYLRVLAHSVSVPFTPLVSHMESTAGYEEIRKMFYNISGKLFYIFSAICVSLFVFGETFIFIWMGEDFGLTVEVLHILIIPMALHLPQIPANSVLLGLSKHKYLLAITMMEAIGNIILSLILVQKWGIIGVAWGTAIPQLIIYSIVYPLIFNKVISGNLKYFYWQMLQKIFYGLIFTLPISLILIKYNGALSWIGFLTNVAIVGLFIIIGFFFVVLSKEERDKIISKIKKMI